MSSGDYLLRDEAKEQISAVCKEEEIARLRQENELLRKALAKCSPFEHSPYEGHNAKRCKFCFSHPQYPHKPDCEYIKLTKI